MMPEVAVPCRRCGALQWYPCRRRGGGIAAGPHRKRVMDWNRLELARMSLRRPAARRTILACGVMTLSRNCTAPSVYGRECGACLVEQYTEQRIRAEGCDPKLYDPVEVIVSRLAGAGVKIEDVRAAVYLGQPISSAVFWGAVYGPAYPEAVMT